MRVLWFTNHILPDHAVALGKEPVPTGGWMSSLADALAVECQQVELGIATNVRDCPWSKKQINGKIYVTIPISYNVNYETLPSALIQGYRNAVEEFKPDIIHIHGTEYFHGLITGRKYVTCPTVISIQGLVDVCKNHYWGNIGVGDLVKSRTLRDWVKLDGLIEQKIKWHFRSKWEREIFAFNKAFIGRTLWDRAHTLRMNPDARYYHCDDLLRTPFYETKWDINHIRRHSIYASSALYPIKGFHTLIKAVSRLRRYFSDITVRTPLAAFYRTDHSMKTLWNDLRSGGYSKYLTQLIKEEGIADHVFSLGMIDAQTVAQELQQAHVFALPSFMENSPNSLAEAMLVGTPSVASYVGGVPSMILDGQSALCYQSGDDVMLAEHIRKIFTSDKLATRLSVHARGNALIRHSKETIVMNIINIYKDVIRQT